MMMSSPCSCSSSSSQSSPCSPSPPSPSSPSSSSSSSSSAPPLVDVRIVPSTNHTYFRRHSHWWQVRYDPVNVAPSDMEEAEAPMDEWAASFSPFSYTHHRYHSRSFVRDLHEEDEEDVLVTLYQWCDESENIIHNIVYKHYSTHSVCENVELEIALYHLLHTSSHPYPHLHLLHPRYHIVPLLGWERDPRDETYQLAFPYIAPRTSSPILSLDDVSLYIYQLLITLQYIHSHNIIHRNIKRANIIMDEYGHLILIDFEHSVIHNPSITYELIGNPHSRAPEVASAWINPANRIERPVQKRRCGRSMSRTPCHRLGTHVKPVIATTLPPVMEESEPVFIPSHIEIVHREDKPKAGEKSEKHPNVDDASSSSSSHVSSSPSVDSSTIDLSHTSTTCTISTSISASTSTPSPISPSSPSQWSRDSDTDDDDDDDDDDDSDDEEMETLRIGTFTTAIDMFGVGIVAAELLLTDGNDTYHILPPPSNSSSHRSYSSSRVVEDHIWLAQRMSTHTPYDVFLPYYTSLNQHRMSHEWADLIIHLLDMSPKTRYTAEQALSHPAMRRGHELYQQRMQLYRDEIQQRVQTSVAPQPQSHPDGTSLSPLYGKRIGVDLDIEPTHTKKQRVDVDFASA